MIRELKCYPRLLISTSTASSMKSFGFQSDFDSSIFRFIASIHLDRSFCILRATIGYAIGHPFFHSTNTFNVYNENWYEHKQLSACVNILQLCFIMFWRFPKLCNVSYNETIYLVFICSKGNIDCNRTLMTILLHHHCMPGSLNSNYEWDITT